MKLDRLPQQITGFFDRCEAPHSLDAKTFKSACHLVAQMDGGSVENVDLDLLGKSYYAATLRTPTDHVSVLCNCVYPYLAFVPPEAFGIGLPDEPFVQPAHLAALFSASTDFQPLDADWLSMDLPPDLLEQLSAAELKQLKYWKPQRVGDVIFNNWD